MSPAPSLTDVAFVAAMRNVIFRSAETSGDMIRTLADARFVEVAVEVFDCAKPALEPIAANRIAAKIWIIFLFDFITLLNWVPRTIIVSS
jgi:hypothetical protein